MTGPLENRERMSRIGRLLVVGVSAALALTVAVAPVSAAPLSAKPTPTVAPTPTPGPLTQKVAADAAVATLAEQIMAAQAKIAAAQVVADAAQQQYTIQTALSAQAAAAAEAANKQRQQMQDLVDKQHVAVTEMVTSAYESGVKMPGAAIASLITAPDPQSLVTREDMRRRIQSDQADVLADYSQKLDALTAAQKAAADALAQQTAATAAAQQAVQDAQTAMALASTEKVNLDTALASAQAQAAAAAMALAQSQSSLTWLTPDQAKALNDQYRAQAAAAAALPIAPNPGHWTAEMGQSVANRALQWLGTPYAWNGGNVAGPTRGVAVDYDSRNDGNIIGFDCSGLVLYAWGPYLRLPHLAASQYLKAGSLHPAATDLLPGDLVFWSSSGGASGISHVAIYIGNGNVVQAPASGDVVKVSPLNGVESGYFGATRPLT